MKVPLVILTVMLFSACASTDADNPEDNQSKDITSDLNNFAEELWNNRDMNESKIKVTIDKMKGGEFTYTGEIVSFTDDGAMVFDPYHQDVATDYGSYYVNEISYWFDTGDPEKIMHLKKGDIITIKGTLTYGERDIGIARGYQFYFSFDNAQIK